MVGLRLPRFDNLHLAILLPLCSNLPYLIKQNQGGNYDNLSLVPVGRGGDKKKANQAFEQKQ